MTTEQPSRRQDPRPALVAAAGVLVVLAAILALSTVVSWIGTSTTPEVLGLTALSLLQQIGIVHLPYAAGVFASLAWIAPVGPASRLGTVIVRGLVAAASGAVLTMVVQTILLGLAEPTGVDLARGAAGAAGTALSDAPLVVLAAILLWMWWQRHPLRAVLRRAFDEV